MSLELGRGRPGQAGFAGIPHPADTFFIQWVNCAFLGLPGRFVLAGGCEGAVWQVLKGRETAVGSVVALFPTSKVKFKSRKFERNSKGVTALLRRCPCCWRSVPRPRR